MRPIAALAPAPLRFPDAVVASPGRLSLIHILGEVPGVGHSATAMFSSAQAVAAVQRALTVAARND